MRLDLIGLPRPASNGFRLRALCQPTKNDNTPSEQLGASSQLASCLSESLKDELPSLFRLPEHQRRREPQDPEAGLSEPAVAPRVRPAASLHGMIGTINFHNEPGRRSKEVH